MNYFFTALLHNACALKQCWPTSNHRRANIIPKDLPEGRICVANTCTESGGGGEEDIELNYKAVTYEQHVFLFVDNTCEQRIWTSDQYFVAVYVYLFDIDITVKEYFHVFYILLLELFRWLRAAYWPVLS
jgi:hypothetical protein